MEDIKFQQMVLERLAVIETILKNQDYKSLKEQSDFISIRTKENEKKIEKLENNQKWVVCFVLGIVIAGIIKISLGI